MDQKSPPLVPAVETPAGVYVDEGNGMRTILPRCSPTGGIQGLNSPYPPIVQRTFDAKGHVTERMITGLGEEPRPVASEPAGIPPPDPLPGSEQPERPVDGKDLLGQLAGKVEALMARLDRPVAAKAVPLADAGDQIVVRFRGPFGEISAPFSSVVAGDGCVALLQDGASPYSYIPPVDQNSVLDLEWPGPAGARIQRQVVNLGLGFPLGGGLRAFVLVAADD